MEVRAEAMGRLEIKRMRSRAGVEGSLREVGGRDLEGDKDFKINLGFKAIFPGQEYDEHFLYFMTLTTVYRIHSLTHPCDRYQWRPSCMADLGEAPRMQGDVRRTGPLRIQLLDAA